MNLREQGYRFVWRDGRGQWVHPLEMQGGDIDTTDMSDAQFEAFVINNDLRMAA